MDTQVTKRSLHAKGTARKATRVWHGSDRAKGGVSAGWLRNLHRQSGASHLADGAQERKDFRRLHEKR